MVRVLFDAFREYPGMRYLLRDSGHRYDEHLKRVIGFFCDARILTGIPLLGVHQDGGLVAAAICDPPGAELHTEPVARALDELRGILGAGAFARMEVFENVSTRHAPKAPAFFVGMVGVQVDRQRQGLGHAIIRYVQAQAQARPDGAPVWLTTEAPENVPFYQELGFEVLGEGDVEDLHTWCMAWSPDRTPSP